MSTESASRPNPSRDFRNYRDRVGDTLSVLVGGRVIDAELRRVTLDCSDLRPRLQLHVATDGGTVAISPDAVVG